MKPNLDKLKQEKSMKELLEFGIIIIDKPAGKTSFDVSDFVRRKLGLKKTSHFGVLDPMVTGVLPVALSRAVRLTDFFIREDKEYVGEMLIHEDIAVEEIKKKIKEKFTGKIMQKPPVRSNVKREEREREIKSFEILGKKEKVISFRADVQGGTYIRKLVHDLGEALGIGAHMIKLRRTKAGIFHEKDLVTIEQFEKAVSEYKEEKNEKPLRKIIIPAEIITELFPVVQVKESSLKEIFAGSPIHKKDLINPTKEKFDKEQIICIFSGDRFIEMAQVINEGDSLAKPKFVLQPM
jgi:H/ACA ribonucleoprotein complex subunit 4